MGWSKGTAIAGRFAEPIRRWSRSSRCSRALQLIKGKPTIGDASQVVGAWRASAKDEAPNAGCSRRARGMARNSMPLMSSSLLERGSSPVIRRRASSPPVLRAPNGVILDAQRFWMKKPDLGSGGIECPVLIVMGEWDADTPTSMANRIFPLLTRAKSKKLAILGRGTHTIALERTLRAVRRGPTLPRIRMKMLSPARERHRTR